MGLFTSGIGLISGINTASLINQLIAIESRGKVSLQQRLANLQQQQAALLDLNASLLNFKTTAGSLRLNQIFQSAFAASSNPGVLNATATGAAQPGTFEFIVKQLASASQQLSKGFTDTRTPVGLDSLSFELGNGFVSTNTDLADLNGGAGVRRGKIVITDSLSNTATIDLSAATTIKDVLDKINNNSKVEVTASVEGDHLVITDDNGGTLSVSNASGSFTATDLGIAATDGGPGDADSTADGRLTGQQVRDLGSNTALSSLNDGTGVLIVQGSADLKITTRNGRELNVDLGRVDNPITASTLLEDLNDGDGVIVNDDSTEDLVFVARDGTEYGVDLTGAVTVQDLMDRVSTQTGGVISLTIHADQDKFVVTDTVNPSGLLKVQGGGPRGELSANDLGILNTTGVDAASFDGTLIENGDFTPAASTIQDVIDRINNALDTLGVANGGHVIASIGADGVSLQLVDTVGGGPPSNFKVEGTSANATAARDLGLEKSGSGGTIAGDRIIAGLNSVLVRSLNGGQGLNGDDTLVIQDRSGSSDTFTLDENGSLSDIIAQINASTSIDIVASINEAGNGLFITDTSGGSGNLIIDAGAGNAADDLGIDTGPVGVASNTVRGANLQLRYVSEGTFLSQLNYGRGIGSGSFRLTDGEGDQVTINIGADDKTLFDVINEINSIASANGVDVTARVNNNGDGLLIENDLGSGILKVDAVSGTTARDLNILGQADANGADIDGSYETVVQLNASDTLDEIVDAINAAGIPITASILNTGAGPTPYHLVFSSQITGLSGDLSVDSGTSFDLGLSTLSAGQDSEVFFGSSDPARGVLIRRSDNTLDDLIDGVQIDLVSASDDPVTVTVTRDEQAIVDAIDQFVQDFNDAISSIDSYDFFDLESQKKGILLGNSTTLQVRNSLLAAVQGPATGVQTQYQYLSQVGITVGANGELNFDQAKFQQAYDADPEAVENLFAAFEADTTTQQEIAPGVTVNQIQTTFTELGFGDLFDQLLGRLTDPTRGVLALAGNAFQDQIDLTQNRIEDLDARLALKRTRLEREFASMEMALAKLQAQNNVLVSMLGNISLAQSLF